MADSTPTGSPDSAGSAQPVVPVPSAADEPFGLWATGRARYQRPQPPAPPRGPVDALARYRPSRLRAIVAGTLVALAVALAVTSLLLNLWLYRLADGIDAGTVTAAEIALHDSLVPFGEVGYAIVLFASAIAVLAWLSRVVDNLPSLTSEPPAFGPRAAIVWWFVPVASLFIPYQIVADVVRRVAIRPRGWVVVAWWVLFLGGNYAMLLVDAVAVRMDTTDGLREFVGVAMVALVPRIASGLLLIHLMQVVERGCAARAASLGWVGRPQVAWGGPAAASFGVIQADPSSLERLTAPAQDAPPAPPPSPG